jgi:hypothetical protein
MNFESERGEEVKTKSAEVDRRKLRWLWIGLGTYFLIFLNALRYATVVPYQIFILGALINGAVIVTIIMAMRRVYKRLGK